MSMIGQGIRLTEDRLREMLESPEDVYDSIEAGYEPEVDLDKAWDAIRFLLRRVHPNDPLSEFLVEGGVQVGDDLGYGPGVGYFGEEVSKIASLLAATSTADLRTAFVPEEMMKADIYPQMWDRDPADDDTLGYVVAEFEKLKTFIEDAQVEKQALLFWIS